MKVVGQRDGEGEGDEHWEGQVGVERGQICMCTSVVRKVW